MKHLLCVCFTGCLFACAPGREIQANMVDASLVKIDIVNRFPNVQQKMLTWKSEGHGEFVTFEPVTTNVALGTIVKAMITKSW